jgi:hypothetical protein
VTSLRQAESEKQGSTLRGDLSANFRMIHTNFIDRHVTRYSRLVANAIKGRPDHLIGHQFRSQQLRPRVSHMRVLRSHDGPLEETDDALFRLALQFFSGGVE